MKSISTLALILPSLAARLFFPSASEPDDKPAHPTAGYAEVNGLRMYYEVYGSGEPLVLLHGGVSTIQGSFEKVLPHLAKTRRIVAIEQQGHGHTADVDRPLSYEQMADDTDALLEQLHVERADLFGWSDGAIVAMQVAVRHPARARKLVLLGTSIDNNDALGPEILAWLGTATAEDFGPEAKASYTSVAPDPAAWPTLIAKLKKLWTEFEPIPPAVLREIKVPVLIMAGDRGGDRPEHAAKIYRLLPDAQLAVLPGTTHFALMEHPEWVLAMMGPFLDAPMPKTSAAGNGDVPQGHTEKVSSKDGTPIAFARSGRGPALILVAGALTDRSGSARLAALLAPHFTVINYDRRGRGDSGDTQPYAVEREVEDIEALIDSVGGSAFVFGSSSGAALALEATNGLPTKVTKAVLFEPPFIVDTSRPPVPEDFVKQARDMVAGGRRGDAVEYFMTVAVGVPTEFVAQMRQAPSWRRMEKLAHTLAYDGAVLGDRLAGQPLPVGRWAAATAPVLVLDGDASDGWLRTAAKALSDNLPNATRRSLEGQDHSAPFRAPEVLAPVLVEFLSEKEFAR